MTVEFDDSLNFGPTAGDPLTNDYTPIGTVRALVMLGAQNSSVRADSLDAAYVEGITYGGVPMEPIEFDPGALAPFPHDAPAGSGNGVGNMWGFFLGSGIPTGTQEVVVDLLGAAATFTGVLWGFTAAGDVVVDDAQGSSDSALANPSIDLTLSTDAYPMGMLKSGHPGVGDVGPGSGWFTDREQDQGGGGAADSVTSWISSDVGELGAGVVTVDWTATSEAAGIVAVAIRESGGGGGGAPVEKGLHGALELNGLVLPVRMQDGARYQEYGVLRPYQDRHRPHVIGRKRVPDE